MTANPIRLERDGEIAVVTLDRPETRNALDREMVGALHDILTELETDPTAGAAIFEGAGGKAFVSGADIAQLRERDAIDSLAGINQKLFERIEALPLPTIAAVRGYALGGGCELALACDLRVSGESGRFGQPEVTLGIMPGAGGTQRLPKLVGLGRAKELVLTGRIIDAAEALEIGLVNRVVPDARVLAEAKELAGQILRNGRLAVRMAKTALNVSFHAGETGRLLESVGQAVLFESREKRERMDAFLQKRARKSGEQARRTDEE